MKMNLPNRLTMLRMILVPFVAYFTLYDVLTSGFVNKWLIGGLLFGAAAVTDAYDGKIARSRGLVTDFGKLMDPVADKMLVISVMVCFMAQHLCSPWVVLITLLREFLVTSVRMVAAGKGVVIPANKWGKAKTITQCAVIGTAYFLKYTVPVLYELLPETGRAFAPYADISVQAMFWLTAAITLISGYTYVRNSKELFLDA